MQQYDFKTLSPTDFEVLVRDLLAAEHGWRLEAFGHGPDGGVDLRGWVRGSKVVVQCKHYAGSTFADLRASARREAKKMDSERPGRYLFVTSQSLSRTQKDALAGDLFGWLRTPADLLIQSDLNGLLGKHSEIERQHFKLWLASTGVLERVVQSGLWARSEALLEDVSARVKLYVRNAGYERASTRLDQWHIVVLTGAPGVGKSLLAEMLLLSHWHNDWQVVSVSDDINEAWNSYRPSRKQIFLYDDFLGQTDISERGSKNEDSRIVRFMDRVASDPTKRLVMTTRSQILKQAGLRREVIARGGFQLRECVIEVSDYGPIERAHILYNHLYFSALSRSLLSDYVAGEHYWRTIDHPNFSPRIIEQVIRRGAGSASELSRIMVSTLDRPIDLWGTMFAQVLSEVARRIVLSIAAFPVAGVDADELRSVSRRNASPIEYTHALKALEGTFVSINIRNDVTKVSYANPSVRDFVLATVDDEPDYAEDLLVNARGLSEIAILLQYASSEANDRPKYPRLAMRLGEIPDRILGCIDSIIDRHLAELSVNPSRFPGVRHSVLRPLAEILEPASAVVPQVCADVLNHMFSILDSIGPVYGSEILGPLTRAYTLHHSSNMSIAMDRLHDLIEMWGESMYTAEEVSEFAAYLDNYSGQLAPHLDAQGTLTRFAEDALRNEIDNMSMNRNDEESDDQWLDSVETMAERLQILDRLQADIEHERDSIRTHYEDRENDEEVAPTSDSGYVGFSLPPGQRTRSQIGSMFRQLS